MCKCHFSACTVIFLQRNCWLVLFLKMLTAQMGRSPMILSPDLCDIISCCVWVSVGSIPPLLWWPLITMCSSSKLVSCMQILLFSIFLFYLENCWLVYCQANARSWGLYWAFYAKDSHIFPYCSIECQHRSIVTVHSMPRTTTSSCTVLDRTVEHWNGSTTIVTLSLAMSKFFIGAVSCFRVQLISSCYCIDWHVISLICGEDVWWWNVYSVFASTKNTMHACLHKGLTTHAWYQYRTVVFYDSGAG